MWRKFDHNYEWLICFFIIPPLNIVASEITFIMTVVRENTELTEGVNFLYKENEFLNAEVGGDGMNIV